MTFYKRYTGTFKDVKAIRLICHKCKASISVVPEEIKKLQDTCPNCGEPWFTLSDADRLDEKTIKDFLVLLKTIRKRSDDAKLEIQIELEQPE